MNSTDTITKETQSPLQIPRPPGRFRVMLQSQKCDCGEYQTKHLPCSHVMTVNLSILISWTMCRYYSLYNTFCTSTRTPLVYCHTNQCGKNMNEISGILIQGERGLQRVILFQLAFLLRWTKKKMNGKVEKNMEFADNIVITETIVLTYIHIKFFLSQV